MTHLDPVGGNDLSDLTSDQLVSVLSSDRYQLTNHGVGHRGGADGALAIEGVHGVLHGLLGIGVGPAHIPGRRGSIAAVVQGVLVVYV